MASSPPTFDNTSFIYSSPRPRTHIPSDVDMLAFLIQSTSQRCFHHRLALIDSLTLESVTFSQLRLRILHTARCLSFLGVRQYDVVLLLSPNSVTFPIAFFGIVSLGAVATTANPLCQRQELSKQIKDAGAKLVITVPELLDRVVDSGLPIVLIGGERAHKKHSSVRLLSEAMEEASAHRVPAVRIRQSDTAALLYSSGTTGVAKGVILSHRNFISAAVSVNADAVSVNERDLTMLCVIPMFHVYGLSVIVYAQLQMGNTIVTMPKFDFIQMLEAIQRYHITSLPIVPPIAIALAKQEIVQKYDFSSVIELTTGAAPLGKETLEEVSHRLNIPDARQGYGMTETSGIISIVKLRSTEKKYSSVGPLIAGMEAVVVDASTGERLPPNKQGELWVRGPCIMQGYLNNLEATAATLDKDGWLHTGDLVYIDNEGSIYVMDRLKELIKYKGLQVAPAELEAVLLTHSEILDAAVVPCPDNDAGEIPVAYVVRLKGSSLCENDVSQFVASQVAPYKKVRKVYFIDAIPKSSSGKILRRELTQQARSKL